MISKRTTTAIIIAAAAIGTAVDQLLLRVDSDWGVNVPIALGLLAVAGMVIPPKEDRAPWAWLAAMFFASMWAIRDADLLAVDLLAALALASLPLLRERQVRLAVIPLVELVFAPIRTAGAITIGTMNFLGVAQTQVSPGQLGGARGRAIGAGILIAAPFVMLFGALFASADPVFDSAIGGFFAGSIGPLFSHSATAGLLAWGTAGYLWIAAKPSRATTPEIEAPVIGRIQVMTPLIAILGVFTLFVGVQATSLFRGAAFVETTTGLTYAEYARHGFFELVFASMLVLPLLYFSPAMAGALDERGTRLLRGIMAAQIALTALVLASALWRMGLYISAYGLTEDRVDGTAVMIWIAATLGVFGLTVLRGRPQHAAFGSLIAAVVTLATLNLANPNATIARYNLDNQTGREIDFEHLARLGGDAVPVLVSQIDQVPAASRCQVITSLRKRYLVTDSDWRVWNLGRQRAHDAVTTLAPVGPCEAESRPEGRARPEDRS